MVYVKRSRAVSGDPKRIWEFINEVERYPEWMPGVVEARVIAGSGGGLGRRQLLKTDMKMGKGEILQEVIAWDPPHRVTWQHVRDVVNGREVEHAREIKTTLSITNEDGRVTFRMIGSWEPLADSEVRMTRSTVARNFERALRNLARLIETDSARPRRGKRR